MNKRLHFELVLTALLLSAIVILVFAPDAFLTMHLRAFLPWWAMGAMVVGLAAFWKRFPLLGSVAFCGAVGIVPQTVVPSVGAVRTSDARGLRVAHLNVFQRNDDHASVIASVLRIDADVISVQEVGPEWASALRIALEPRYPHAVVVPRTNCTGIALFSRLPFQSAEVVEIAGTPFIDVSMWHSGVPLRVIAAHATSPGGYGRFVRRNRQLEELARMVRDSEIPVILVGDLNTVHWDDAYRRFCAVSGARPINSSLEPTWPSIGPFALIPLDHALIKGPLSPSRFRSFRISGSDHRGLVAEIRHAHAS